MYRLDTDSVVKQVTKESNITAGCNIARHESIWNPVINCFRKKWARFYRGINHVSVLKKICVKDQEELQKYILFEETVFQRLLPPKMRCHVVLLTPAFQRNVVPPSSLIEETARSSETSVSTRHLGVG
jgi:hypothetical protein